MKINFTILTTLLAACSRTNGCTIDGMKNSLECESSTEQVQVVIDFMINKKLVVAMPGYSQNGKRQPTRFIKSRLLGNQSLLKAG